MNEEQKNIETCLPENILSEVANVPTDPQFVSLTDEALDPLKQQALQQAGYDGYKEVVMYHQPYTFTSQVKQMKSNLILLLRRLWRFTFGRDTTSSSDAGTTASSAAGSSAASAAAPIRSLADMWQHYITRLKGNPEYGIPSRLSSLTDLPDAPALLADRKIGGVPEAADGMSLVHLLNDTSAITELTDDNTGWTMTKSLLSFFPNAKIISLSAKEIRGTYIFGSSNISILKLSLVEYISLGVGSNSHGQYIVSGANVETLSFDSMTKFTGVSGSSWYWFGNLPSCKKVSFPVLSNITYNGNRPGYSIHYFADCPILEEVHFNVLRERLQSRNMTEGATDQNMGARCPHLILFEIGQNYYQSLYLAGWSPTMALRTDTDAVDYVDLRKDVTLENNLQQFLSNFRDYIAERLTDKGKGFTLTLSQEVRNAIHAAEATYGIENIIITQKGWTISPAPN